MGSQRERKVKEEQLVGELFWAIDGMTRRESRELVGAIERTTAEAEGGYRHCIKRKIFFGL